MAARGSGARKQQNGAVIGTMWRESAGLGLTEDLSQVLVLGKNLRGIAAFWAFYGRGSYGELGCLETVTLEG